MQKLHKVLSRYFEKGHYEVLWEGVDAQVLAQELGISAADVCKVAEHEARKGLAVIVSRDSSGCRLLTKEADAIRTVLTAVPHVDFKLRIVARRALKLKGERAWTHELIASVRDALQEDASAIAIQDLAEELAKHDIPCFKSPYVYQFEAWKIILRKLLKGEGGSVAITAGTGEGKTEAFLVPWLLYVVACRVTGRDPGRAVLIYPRKALAEDQLNRIITYLYHVNVVLRRYGLEPVRVGVLDGDTPATWIRDAVLGLRGNPCSCGTWSTRNLLDLCRGLRCPVCGKGLKIESPELRNVMSRDYVKLRDLVRERVLKPLSMSGVEGSCPALENCPSSSNP